jgi:YVTN family beta-propeller protein
VSNEPNDNVSRLDPTTNAVAATIALGAGKHPCSGLAAGFGSLWVPNCGDNTLARLDLKTNAVTTTVPTTIGDSEGGIAVGAGSVWLMIDKKGTLARIDPATSKVVAEISVAAGSFGIAFGEGAVWVTSSEQHLVTRVNPFTNLVVETIAVGKSPRFIDRLEADGHVAQHVLIETELTFHFRDERRLRVEAEQHVMALPVLLDPVGQTAQAPVLALLDLAALGGEFGGDIVGDLLDLLLRDVVPCDQHGFIQWHMRLPLACVSPWPGSGRSPGWREGIAGHDAFAPGREGAA